MGQGLRGRFAGWRDQFRHPSDPLLESAPQWARRRTALTITAPAFAVLEFTLSPLVGFVVSGAAGGLTALALVVVVYAGALAVAPVAQRNALRREVVGRSGDIEFKEWLETVRWEIHLPIGPQGRVFDVTIEAIAWVWVKNGGPTASFAAEIRDVAGVPSEWGDYFVAESAWDQKHSPTIEIPRGGRRKLKVAAIARSPQRGFWFWTSEGQVEAPGWQWWMGDNETGDVRFDVVVVNTATDQTAIRQARIMIPTEASSATFALSDDESEAPST